jgi:hypothetical protein
LSVPLSSHLSWRLSSYDIFPFAHIADAFAYLEQGHAKGKVVVQMVEQL